MVIVRNKEVYCNSFSNEKNMMWLGEIGTKCYIEQKMRVVVEINGIGKKTNKER